MSIVYYEARKPEQLKTEDSSEKLVGKARRMNVLIARGTSAIGNIVDVRDLNACLLCNKRS